MKNQTPKFQARIFHAANPLAIHVMLIWSVGLKLYNQKVVFKGNNTILLQKLDDGEDYLIHVDRGSFPHKVSVISKRDKRNFNQVSIVSSLTKTSRCQS